MSDTQQESNFKFLFSFHFLFSSAADEIFNKKFCTLLIANYLKQCYCRLTVAWPGTEVRRSKMLAHKRKKEVFKMARWKSG
jgi:hypothetical protein